MAEPNSNRMYIIIGAIVVVVALLFFFMSGSDDPATNATATDGAVTTVPADTAADPAVDDAVEVAPAEPGTTTGTPAPVN